MLPYSFIYNSRFYPNYIGNCIVHKDCKLLLEHYFMFKLLFPFFYRWQTKFMIYEVLVYIVCDMCKK